MNSMKRSELSNRRPLSDTALDNLEPEHTEYVIHDGNGLYFRVRPNGNKDWRLRYKNPLTQKLAWKGLGGYPTISGKLARTKAKELQERLSHGENIAQVELKQSYALIDLIDEWLQTRKVSDSTIKRDKGGLYRHVIPFLGKRDYRTIETHEWLDLFTQRQDDTGSIEYVRRVCNLCYQAYTFAKIIKKTIKHNPLDDVIKYLQKAEPENMKHVSQDEIGQLLRDIKKYPTEQGRYALLLLALTYCRPSELIKAQWHEFDLEHGLWFLTAERMKMKKPFIRPLARQAIEILQILKQYSTSSYVFPKRGNDNQPASIGLLEQGLKRMGYDGKQTPHGFRHIASTYMNEHTKPDGTKWDSRIIEFSLAHSIHGVAGKYNKAEYLDDRRELAQWYADELDKLYDKIANDGF